jgi:predicted transcriptional regulator
MNALAAEDLSTEDCEQTSTDPKYRARFIAAVQAGLDDCEAGRMIGHEEFCRQMDAICDEPEAGAK